MVRGDRAARSRQPGACRLLPATTATGACELSGGRALRGWASDAPAFQAPGSDAGTREGCKDYKLGKWWTQPGGTGL